MSKHLSDHEKLDKLFLKLHRFHSFRESHKSVCKLCNAYYKLYELIIKDNAWIN